MSPKTRSKPRSNPRRSPARARRDLPVLPLAVGGAFLVIFGVLLILYQIGNRASGVTGQAVANIRCDTGEQLATHFHAHLDILYRGQPVTVPAQIGIPGGCLYWLHTHDTTGAIHVEAPKEFSSRQFTVGDFFKVWGQPLSSTQVSTLKVGPGDQVKAWVDGKPYSGDPAKIGLGSHEQIVLEIGPPFTDPPPTFTWDTSQFAQ